MIDDATLAAWDGHLQEKDLPVEWLVSQFKRAIAEIRRLRESLIEECPRNCTTFQQYGDCEHRHPVEMAKLKRDLAAHRAVVRELAGASKKYIDEVQANLRAAQSIVPGPPEPPRWAALQHLQAWLAHPLVQQAREKKP